MTCLLDTAVLVDLIRKYPPAQAWIRTQSSPGISPVVWLEVLQGASDKNDQQKALRLLASFERIQIEPADFEWAIASMLRFSLSHDVGALDCLIASVNHRLQIPLYTRNMKHFAPLLGPLVSAPYS